VHVKILHVHAIRFFVVVSAETSDSFIKHIGFYSVHTFDNYIKTNIKLLIVNEKRVFNIPLNEIFLVEGILGQI